MKALVVYDSQYGNTEKIAKAIGAGFTGDVKVMKVGDVKREDIAWSKFVIIGSPTQGGRASMPIRFFLRDLPKDVFTGKRLAAFDTRTKGIFVKMFGFAADKIETSLRAKSGNPTAKPQGFFVKSTKGPLVEGEEAKATEWARAIASGSPTIKFGGEIDPKSAPGDVDPNVKE